LDAVCALGGNRYGAIGREVDLDRQAIVWSASGIAAISARTARAARR
jgi:hypothetical protein